MSPPSYPKSAIEQRQVGVVSLRVDVDAKGYPTDVQVLSATNPGVFEAVSIAAARSWTYRPALKNGKPVAGAVRIPITFAMDESDEVTETAR
jgi:TonB family protein